MIDSTRRMTAVPDVSVIVPVYNALAYLEESVGSLLAQTHSSIEVILVDDGSTDGSGELCDRLADRDSRVSVIHKSNSGAGLSRNEGLARACGEYVTFLDADDLLAPGSIERLLGAARAHELDIVKAGRCFFITGASPTGEKYDTPLRIFDDPAQLQRIALCYIGQPRGEADRALHFEGGVWGTLFRREMLEEAGVRFVSEREYGSEDYIFNFEAARAASRMGQMEDTLVHYRLSPGSISRTVKTDSMERLAIFAHRMEQRLAAAGYDREDARLAGMGYFLEIGRGYMKNMLLSREPYSRKIAWCKAQCRLPYVQEILTEYPPARLTKAHRLHLWLMRHKAMHILYLLTLFHH